MGYFSDYRFGVSHIVTGVLNENGYGVAVPIAGHMDVTGIIYRHDTSIR